MDYKELATDLLSGCEENCANCEYAGDSEFECTMTKLAATAITDLLDRAEVLEHIINLENIDLGDSPFVLVPEEKLKNAIHSACITGIMSTYSFYREKDLERQARKWTELYEKTAKKLEKQREIAESAKARCETLEKVVKEYQDTIVPGYREQSEKAERERDAAVRQLASLEICGYCKNGQCTTRGGTKECKFDWNGGQKEE